MHPGATLFLDVCVQRDFWPGGAWPLLDADSAANVATLFALAAELGVRQGGVRCAHASGDAPPGAPLHAAAGGAGAAPIGAPTRPAILVSPAGTAPALDRAHAYYVASGCTGPPDGDAASRAVVEHLLAGVRDAVVFGAGVETALDRAVDACLHRRVRTHVVLDAAGVVDAAHAQQVIGEWKRRGVDGLTTATVARLLRRAAN
jgi:hypothetical protein